MKKCERETSCHVENHHNCLSSTSSAESPTRTKVYFPQSPTKVSAHASVLWKNVREKPPAHVENHHTLPYCLRRVSISLNQKVPARFQLQHQFCRVANTNQGLYHSKSHTKVYQNAHAGKSRTLAKPQFGRSKQDRNRQKLESSIDQNLLGTCIFAIQKTLQPLVSQGVLICWWEVRNEDTWNSEHLAISFASFLHWEGSQ